MRLTQRAKVFLGQVTQSTGALSAEAEQQINKAAETKGKNLTAEEIHKILLQALPDQVQNIDDCIKRCGHHPDNTNATFLTQIIDTRIEKPTEEIVPPAPPRPPVPAVRDPYIMALSVDPRADFVMCYNARDVDENGRPLLMKVLARERADLSKLDLSNVRLKPPATPESLDIERIANDADRVDVQDADEHEFEFGDPLRAVALDCNGALLSVKVRTNPTNIAHVARFNGRHVMVDGQRTLVKASDQPFEVRPRKAADTTIVTTFDERITFDAGKANFADLDNWHSSKILDPGRNYSNNNRPTEDAPRVSIDLARGVAFEPGSVVYVEAGQRNPHGGLTSSTFSRGHRLPKKPVSTPGSHLVVVKADPQDANMLGTESGSFSMDLHGKTYSEFLRTPIRIGTGVEQDDGSVAWDNHEPGGGYRARYMTAGQLLFQNADKITVSSKTGFTPGHGHHVTAASIANESFEVRRRPSDSERLIGAQTVEVTLKNGFLKAAEGADVEGWQVQLGYVDADGTWNATSKPQAITGTDSSGEQKLSVEISGFDNRLNKPKKSHLRIRVFNAEGFPATSVSMQLDEVAKVKSGDIGSMKLSLAGADVTADPQVRTLDRDAIKAANITAEKRPLPDDPEQDGQRVHICLPEGLMKSAAGISLKDWLVEVGYKDPNGDWVRVANQPIGDKSISKQMGFDIDIDDATALHRANGTFEVRYFSPDGPSDTLKFDFGSLRWAPDVVG